MCDWESDGLQYGNKRRDAFKIQNGGHWSSGINGNRPSTEAGFCMLLWKGRVEKYFPTWFFYLSKLKDQLINKGKYEQKSSCVLTSTFFGVSMISVYFHSNLKTFANLIDYCY